VYAVDLPDGCRTVVSGARYEEPELRAAWSSSSQARPGDRPPWPGRVARRRAALQDVHRPEGQVKSGCSFQQLRLSERDRARECVARFSIGVIRELSLVSLPADGAWPIMKGVRSGGFVDNSTLPTDFMPSIRRVDGEGLRGCTGRSIAASRDSRRHGMRNEVRCRWTLVQRP